MKSNVFLKVIVGNTMKIIKKIHNGSFGRLIVSAGAVFLVACGASNPPIQSDGHISASDISQPEASIPPPIVQVSTLKRPLKRERIETYTVVVNQVPVSELLFSMARDARINLDIENNIKGLITMNAIDQRLAKILDRIASQSEIIYILEGDTLVVRADRPVLRIYDVNYLNIERSSESKVSISTEIGTTSGDISNSGSGGSGGGGGSGDNKAKTTVINQAKNKFWSSLVANLESILTEDETGEKKSGNKNNIIVNGESGTIAVKATAKQHKKIADFIDRVVESAQRQVLIEATVAEVRLSDKYQAGIDWSVIGGTSGGAVTKGGIQNLIGGNLGSAPFFQLAGTGSINGNPLNITLKALETFGDVKVLSSPKVMALNNQTAILKVVDNEVYFTTNVEIDPGSVNQNSQTIIDTNINTVPIGFIMSVTPYISKEDEVTLNIRPTISRIIRFVNDPNPLLDQQGVVSKIPVIQVREIETMLKIENEKTAVIGGLMQDQLDKSNSGVPVLSSIPLLGRLFSYQEEEYIKTELVIFIRPVVIKDASLEGDFNDYKKYLDLDIHKKDEMHSLTPADASQQSAVIQ